MQRLKSTLRWNERSETTKTVFLLVVVIGVTFGGYGLFMVAMNTTTPLVVVTSESMVPTLQVGDLLVLQRPAEDQIQVGDIIVYNADWFSGAPIVHRVVRITEIGGERYFFTKGDNNQQEDPSPCTYEDILGVVVFRIPYLGNVSLAIRGLVSTPLGVVVIIILFGLILFGPEFLCRSEADESEDAEKKQEEQPAEESEEAGSP